MKIAAVVPAAGSPGTLATTAFHGALMEGFSAIGIEAQVIGLTFDSAEWVPEALGDCRSSAPWLPPERYQIGDRADAARRGIFNRTACDAEPCDVTWRLELLLERDLAAFAAEDQENVVLADTRSIAQLRIICRTAHRLGWKVLVLANEALTDVQIDPTTRESYIRCVTRCAAGVWAVSDELAQYWRAQGVPDARIFKSPSVIRASSFSRPVAQRGACSAAYVGNLAHREIGYLLDISQAILAQVPNFELTVYGDAPKDVRVELERVVEERGLAGVVHIERSVAPPDVPAVLEDADVLLLPRSRGKFSSAGFPNKLGEYLASGRPVVVTSVGDIPKYLADGDSASIVPPDDTPAFAAAVVHILRSPQLGDAIGTKGRSVAERLLRSDLVAARLVEHLDALPPASACPSTDQGALGLWRRLVAARPDVGPVKRRVARVVYALFPRTQTWPRRW